jgi:hypothetical protein
MKTTKIDIQQIKKMYSESMRGNKQENRIPVKYSYSHQFHVMEFDSDFGNVGCFLL